MWACGAVLPDAPNVSAFWKNIKTGRYSISEVTPDRWDPALYYDADHGAPDKTYSKIGGWVREYAWDPVKWRLPIPPRVADAMDDRAEVGDRLHARSAGGLRLSGAAARIPTARRSFWATRMAGEKHYLTVLRAYFPGIRARAGGERQFRRAAAEPCDARSRASCTHRIGSLLSGDHRRHACPANWPTASPAGSPTSSTSTARTSSADAACASAMAAINAAVDGLVENEFDVAVTGGIDRNMGASTS